MSHGTDKNKGAVAALLREADALARDFDREIAEALKLAQDAPLTEQELKSLFTRVLTRLRAGAGAGARARRAIEDEVKEMVEQAVSNHIAQRTGASSEKETKLHVELEDRFGLEVRDVSPAPVFLGQQVSLKEGFVDVTKLRLWPENHRLELHLNEFKRRYGRSPSNKELLDILLSRVPFEGVPAADRRDFFHIAELADSIAANGVRVPPIIDWWGVPYDGNRRLAACLSILADPEREEAEVENARWVKVWQAQKTTTAEQIQNIVVALNFEKDLKEQWPEYVRAQQVFDAFEKKIEVALALGTEPDVRQVRRDVAKKFGIQTAAVTRYVRMVEWAHEFQEYHEANGKDESEVMHRTNKYFQYFYELDSGRGEDKLSAMLDRDEGMKALVFDLLYDEKFKRWAQIRDLRKVFADEAATKLLIDAHATPAPEVAKEKVEQAIAEARRKDVSRKQIGAEQRVKEFTSWLEDEATQTTWREHITLGLAMRFLSAIRAADGTVASVIAERTESS